MTNHWGTSHNVALAMKALSSEWVLEALDNGAMTLLQDMLAAALDYEAQQSEPPEAKEALKRVK